MIYALSTCRKVWSTSCQWRPCLARRPWRSLWRRRWWRRTPCRGCYLEVRSRPPSSLHWPPICCVYASRGPGARPRAERRLGMGGDRRPAVQCSVQRWRWQRCNTEPGHVGSDTSKLKPEVGLWCGDITTPPRSVHSARLINENKRTINRVFDYSSAYTNISHRPQIHCVSRLSLLCVVTPGRCSAAVAQLGGNPHSCQLSRCRLTSAAARSARRMGHSTQLS